MTMPSLQTITDVEDRNGSLQETSLGEAFGLLQARWGGGARDRETALRLAFLAWYARAAPTFLTGLPDAVDTPSIFSETYFALAGESSSDAEVCYVIGLMARMFPWVLEDESRWEQEGWRLTAKARLLAPNGVELKWFEGRGAYGRYFAHIFGGSRLGLAD